VQVRSQSPLAKLAPGDGHVEFQRLVAKLPAAAYTCDATGLITYFNKRAVELWGRAPKLNDPVDRFCGSFRLFSADGVPLAHEDCWMARALRDDRAYDGLEIIIERPDGSRVTALAHANPFHDERGEVIGAVNVLIDITERRRAEMARLHLAAIVDSSDDAIVSKNLDGVIQSWNAAAERLFGYTAEEAVGRHISFLMPPERRDEEDRILARLRAGKRIYHFDTVRVRSDGRLIDVSVTISPIRDDAGRIVGASKIVRDIADRKRAEEQIYNLLTRLKEADRRKDEFVATLAHELRGPLAPLWAMLEVVRRGDSDADTLQRAYETMERQLGQMVRLVEDLFDVGRIASNKLQLKKDRVDLASVIGQAVEVCRPLAERAKHQIAVSLPTEPIYVHADPARLAQIFSNLLNNACKYTDEGGRIHLTAERQNGEVLVTVRDTGIGIPADRLASVFEMFSQVTSAAERSRGGLGIGLSVVKRLVDLHGGSVTVASAGPGQGSAFSVRLPILDDKPRALLEPPAKKRPAATARRVLIVDDNTDSAAALAMLLKSSGNKTATAHDGLAAVAAVESFRPDVVLLDLSLPKMDGYEAARRIRSEPWGKDVVLVALTGWGQEEDRRRSKEAGFDEHMVKPVDFDALMKLVASA
jgi:two-component system, chemotaxis family, CheB/CheR fusion protein